MFHTHSILDLIAVTVFGKDSLLLNFLRPITFFFSPSAFRSEIPAIIKYKRKEISKSIIGSDKQACGQSRTVCICKGLSFPFISSKYYVDACRMVIETGVETKLVRFLETNTEQR